MDTCESLLLGSRVMDMPAALEQALAGIQAGRDEVPAIADWAGFRSAGDLVVHGEVLMCGLEAPEFFTFEDIPPGTHQAFLAYGAGWEEGGLTARAVWAVALVADGASPQAVADASYEERADGANYLDEGASVLASVVPGTMVPAGVLGGRHGVADYPAYALATLKELEAEGSTAPALNEALDPVSGANAIVFPTAAQYSSSIAVGSDGHGSTVCIIWSVFE